MGVSTGSRASMLASVGALVLLAAACSPGARVTAPGSVAARSASGAPSSSPAPNDSSDRPGSSSSGGRTPGQPATVTSTVDGDTIRVRFRGRDLDVRLIGVDTPETVDPNEPVQCYGPEASDFTERKLAGRSIRLEFDVERLDRYGRTLAYVWLDGRLFNRTLVADGYAAVSTYPPNVRYVNVFEAAQRIAKRERRGRWGACPAVASGGGSGGGNVTRCDPAYPDVCIPPPPPDLDCSDIRFRSFQVLPPDPHNFDGDGNGIGCET